METKIIHVFAYNNELLLVLLFSFLYLRFLNLASINSLGFFNKLDSCYLIFLMSYCN